jgi:predicted small lipoprotein YifL
MNKIVILMMVAALVASCGRKPSFPSAPPDSPPTNFPNQYPKPAPGDRSQPKPNP